LGLLALLWCVWGASAQAEDIYGLTSDSKLVRFDAATPDVLLSTVSITGLTSGDTLVGIDFRPVTGELYALGTSNRVYILNLTTGAATALGASAFSTPALSGTKFGFDFNPLADRIRVVSENGQNLRLHPTTGANVAGGGPNGADFNAAYATGDVNAGLTPKIAGSAYSENIPGTGATTLYCIDSTQNVLVTQGSLNGTISPNGSAATSNSAPLHTIGKLGITTTSEIGFDISGGSAKAYASIVLQGETASKLYDISLSTGTATLLGSIGTSTTLVDISVVPPPFPYNMVAVNTAGQLLRFQTSNPAITTLSVGGSLISPRGLTGSDAIVAIDYRLANGKMYGLGMTGTTGRLYTLDPVTGLAASVDTTGANTFTVTGTNLGFDFNPVADRVRIISDAEVNLVINPDTGKLESTDTSLTWKAGDTNAAASLNCVGAAYSNNVAGASSTSLYDIQIGNSVNAANGVVALQSTPASGVLSTVGNLGLTPSGNTGFDITSNGNYVMTNNNLYSVNLTTGAATQLGTTNISNGSTTIRDIAGVIDPAIARVQFSADNYSVVEGSTLTVTVTRTGSTSGTMTVDYATAAITTVAAGGTATSSTDYIPVSGTLVFADGEASRTFTVEALSDSTQELYEVFAVTLSNPVGCLVGTPSSATVTVIDFDDRDGDGFSATEETAAGTSDASASDTPFGGAAAGTVDATNLVLTKVAVKLDFLKTNNDSISFSGELRNVANPLTTDGKKFVVNFGGVTNSVALTAKLSGASADKTYSVKISKPKGAVAKFSVKMSKGAFLTLLTDEGLGEDLDSPTKAPRSALVKVLFDSINYQITQALLVTVKTGKGSTASAPK
jgi:hypothetical protein